MLNYVYMEHQTPPSTPREFEKCSILGNLFWAIIKFRNCFGVDRGVRDDRIYINIHNSRWSRDQARFMLNYVYMEHQTPPSTPREFEKCSILGNLFWAIIKFRNCFGVDRGVRDDRIYINIHNSRGSRDQDVLTFYTYFIPAYPPLHPAWC